MIREKLVDSEKIVGVGAHRGWGKGKGT